MNTDCPHCLTRVNLTADGKCPLCRRAIGAPDQRAAEESSLEATREQARFDQALEVALCPMCGAASPAGAVSCPNCGENFVAVGGDLWRQGDKVLVMHKSAELPLRCVKSNQPCTRQLKRSLSWHHPAWYLVILVCGLIPYIIAALIVRKTATIYVGLSEEWFARRQRAMLISWGLSLGGLALVIAGAVTMDTSEAAGGTMILLGLLAFIVGLAFGLLRARIVAVKKIKNDYIWLNGCHADFLAQLPEWTGDAR